MTKKKKVSPVRRYTYQSLSFKVEETSHQPNKSMPSNLAEEKTKFLKTGKTPQFQIQDPVKLAELAGKAKNQIRFDLLGEAEYILEKVRDQYGEGEYFLEHQFGSRISKEEATPMLLDYIEENSLTESIRIHWCDNMPCSAKMVWTGPVVNANKPELRKYSLWINGSDENNYMRESGIKCLMDHEIGTHFFRMVNDGFQPWFSDRGRFGLRNLGGFEGQCTEEGLAAINTALRGRVRLLWGPALAYYTACKAAEMTFKQLFDHIGRYISNLDSRWKQVMRVKRGLTDPNDLGGFGNDQCYFEGAVNILRNMDKIDFFLLMSGKVCYDELDRIKRVVRRDVVKYPVFMRNMSAYLKTLRKMSVINGLGVQHPQRSPPTAYLRRLNERKNEDVGKKPKKVRSSSKLGKGKKKGKGKQTDSESEEVPSFKIDNKFVNIHLNRRIYEEQEAIQLRQENNLQMLVESLETQIARVDSDLEDKLDEKILRCRTMLSEHSWSSEEFKDRLMGQGLEGQESIVFGLQGQGSMVSQETSEKDETEVDCESTMHEERVRDTSVNPERDHLRGLGRDGRERECWPTEEETSPGDRSRVDSSELQKQGDIPQCNIPERPWTEGGGVQTAKSRRGVKTKTEEPGPESLPNLRLLRRKKNRCRSTQYALYEQSMVCGSSNQPPLDMSGSRECPPLGEAGPKGDVFTHRRLNVTRPRQLLHPSVARLTSREALVKGGSQADKVRDKLRVITKGGSRDEGSGVREEWHPRLDIGGRRSVEERQKREECGQKRDNVKRKEGNPVPHRLESTDNAVAHVSSSKNNKSSNHKSSSESGSEMLGPTLDESVNRLHQLYEQEDGHSFTNVMTTSKAISIHQRPPRFLSFKHAQAHAKTNTSQNNIVIATMVPFINVDTMTDLLSNNVVYKGSASSTIMSGLNRESSNASSFVPLK